MQGQEQAEELGKQREEENLRAKTRIEEDENVLRQKQYQAALGLSPNDYIGAEQAVFGTEMSPAGGITAGLDAFNEWKKGNYGMSALYGTAAAATFLGLGPVTKPITKTASQMAKAKDRITPLIRSAPEKVKVKKAEVNKESVYDDVPRAKHMQDEHLVTEFFSPLRDAIENMPIGKKGATGQSISNMFERASNVTASEIEFSDIINQLKPNQIYTKDEVLNMLNPEFETYKVKSHQLPDQYGRQAYPEGEWPEYQRIDEVLKRGALPQENYFELMLQANGRLKISDEQHWSNQNVMAHSRSSLRTFPDGKKRIVVEEIQSGPAEDAANLKVGEHDKKSITFPVRGEGLRDISEENFNRMFMDDNLQLQFSKNTESLSSYDEGRTIYSVELGDLTHEDAFIDSILMPKNHKNKFKSSVNVVDPVSEYVIPKDNPLNIIRNYYDDSFQYGKSLNIDRNVPIREGDDLTRLPDADKIYDATNNHYNPTRVQGFKEKLKKELSWFTNEQNALNHISPKVEELVKKMSKANSDDALNMDEITKNEYTNLINNIDSQVDLKKIINKRDAVLAKFDELTTPEDIAAHTMQYLKYQDIINTAIKTNYMITKLDNYVETLVDNIDSTTKAYKNKFGDTSQFNLSKMLSKIKSNAKYLTKPSDELPAKFNKTHGPRSGITPSDDFNIDINELKLFTSISPVEYKKYYNLRMVDKKNISEKIKNIAYDDRDMDFFSTKGRKRSTEVINSKPHRFSEVFSRYGLPTPEEFNFIRKDVLKNNINQRGSLIDNAPHVKVDNRPVTTPFRHEYGKVGRRPLYEQISDNIIQIQDFTRTDMFDAFFNGASDFSNMMKQVNPLIYRGGPTILGKEGDRIKGMSPVVSRKEYVKKMVLANIALAKKLGIDEVVLPNWKDIYYIRRGQFAKDKSAGDELSGKELDAFFKENKVTVDDALRQEIEPEDMLLPNEGAENRVKSVYEDALKKSLNELTSETNNAIKVGEIELPSDVNFAEHLFYKSNPKTGQKELHKGIHTVSPARTVNVQDFDFNPDKQRLRFADGGLVPTDDVGWGRVQEVDPSPLLDSPYEDWLYEQKGLREHYKNYPEDEPLEEAKYQKNRADYAGDPKGWEYLALRALEIGEDKLLDLLGESETGIKIRNNYLDWKHDVENLDKNYKEETGLGTYININAAKQRYEIDKETGKINPDKIRPPSQGGKV